MSIILYNQFNIFNKIYFFFNELFQPLLDIKIYDKIGISNNMINNPHVSLINYKKLNFTLYLDKYSKLQPIKRCLYKQSKELTFSKLYIIFYEYNKVIDEIIFLNNNYNYSYQIKTKFKNLNYQLINSLEKLKFTYNNNTDINNSISSFISILSKI